MPVDVEKESWYLSAKTYVEGCELPIKYGASYGEKDLLMMRQIAKAKRDYQYSRQPTSREILALLNCNDYENTKIGLAAMRLQLLSEYQVLKKIISFWDHPSWYHREFASAALLDIHRSEIKDYQDLGDMIFTYVKRTNDDLVLANGVRILGKFKDPKYLPFIVKHLRKHDKPLIYYSAFSALTEMDEKYFQQARNQLLQEGDMETLKHFDRTANHWKEWQGFDDPINSRRR